MRSERFVRSTKQECLEHMMYVAERVASSCDSCVTNRYHEERSYRGLGYQSNLGKTLDCSLRRLDSPPAWGLFKL